MSNGTVEAFLWAIALGGIFGGWKVAAAIAAFAVVLAVAPC